MENYQQKKKTEREEGEKGEGRTQYRVVYLLSLLCILRYKSKHPAISWKNSFLVLDKDKVILRSTVAFLLKVFPSFHLRRDIVLPSMCPTTHHLKELSLNCLDVLNFVRVLQLLPLRQLYFIFSWVIPLGEEGSPSLPEYTVLINRHKWLPKDCQSRGLFCPGLSIYQPKEAGWHAASCYIDRYWTSARAPFLFIYTSTKTIAIFD